MKLELLYIHRIKTGSQNIVSFDIPVSKIDAYASVIKKGQPDDRFDVTISNLKKLRSTGWKSQNHHLNGHCMQISIETGQDFPSVKLYVKRLAIKRGLQIKMDLLGNVIHNILDGEPDPISEADMSTLECSWCIDEAHILAAELGITLKEE